MDWLLERQQSIEEGLARRYLTPGGVVLYDLTSTYVEGDHCPLAKRGYSRDGKPGKQQIEFGLLTNGEGVPVAIEAFAGEHRRLHHFPGAGAEGTGPVWGGMKWYGWPTEGC